MITVRDLKISFNGKTLLSGIHMSIPDSTTAVIIGRNGCGKSVLLKCVAGLITPDCGDILIGNAEEGEDRKNTSEAGYVFQKGGLFDSMSVYDNIAFALRRRGMDEAVIRTKVEAALANVSLEDVGSRYPQELSGGMQKRVSLARALCLEPSYMIYDDPTAGLDPVLTDSIGELLNKIRNERKVTSLLVTHDLSLVEKVADSVHMIYNGAMVFSGTRDEFFGTTNRFAEQFIKGELDGPMDSFS